MNRSTFALFAICGAIVTAAVSGLAQPQLRPVTIDDLMTVRAIVDARIAPDGSRVAYVTSTPSLPKNEHEGALFVVPASGGASSRIGPSVQIFNTPVPQPRLRWSPDSTAVAVMALVNGRPQVVAIPIDGSAPRPLTKAPEGVFGFEWSPDGKQIAYLTRDPMPELEARQRQERSFVIRADAPDRPARLAVQDAEQSAERRLLTPVSHYVDAFSWSPDGREIAYSAAPKSGFTSPYYTRIYAVPSTGGTPRTIVDRTGTNSGPRFSPDGRSIAFISTNGKVDIMASRSLAVAPAQGGTAPRVFAMDDAWVNEYVWAADSASIYLQANDGTFGRGEHMFEQALVRVSVVDGRAERIDRGAVVNYSLSLSKDGSRIAYRSIEGRNMGDLVVMDVATRKVTTLTEVNPELRNFALGTLKPISWRSFDGMEIWGLLLTPPRVTAGRKLPLLVYIHGGPGGGFTYGLFPQFMTGVAQVDPYPTEAFASAGYAVLFPMPRGGAGYGEAGQRMIVNAWGEGDYRDIMAGVDKLIADGIADPDRLGVMGASYGGYMTNWVVTQTARFKAASAGASISDIHDIAFLGEGSEFIVGYFKWPWENAASYTAHSPITFAERVTTPLLIQHGEADPRVPISGAWKFYRTLQTMGKTVEFDIYPRGGHVLREPQQQRAQMQRNFDWMRKWIDVNK
jgi:dipeptidyl aminopeptidase/acylaminoacyl peptidase